MLKYAYDTSGNAVGRTLGKVVAPQITGQPLKQIAALGDLVTFSVVLSDTSEVTFQWQFNGADIPGATGDSLILLNISAADVGQYTVLVTNSAGSVISAPAELLLGINGNGDSLRPRLTFYSGAGGSVMVNPMKLSYELGETVSLTAVSSALSVFNGWTGDLNSSSNPVILVIDGNKTVRARFATAAPLSPGLITLWRGETDASDSIGVHHGQFFSGVNATAPNIAPTGKVGGAFNFDGIVHMQIPNSPDLQPAQLTAEAWVFPTSPNANPHTIIARGFYAGTWDLRLVNNIPQFWSHGGQGLEGPSAIPLNEWTHLAISFDGTTKRLYINGAEVAFRGGYGALVYAAGVPVTIGADWANNQANALFEGMIDEVALYNRALTADEVLRIYNADYLGKDFSKPYFTSPANLPDGVLGANYSYQVTTILGTSQITFSLIEGALPSGIVLSQDGLISGNPATDGIFRCTVRATDLAGAFSEQLCVLKVN